jgi:hypothetical protein
LLEAWKYYVHFCNTDIEVSIICDAVKVRQCCVAFVCLNDMIADKDFKESKIFLNPEETDL